MSEMSFQSHQLGNSICLCTRDQRLIVITVINTIKEFHFQGDEKGKRYLSDEERNDTWPPEGTEVLPDNLTLFPICREQLLQSNNLFL